MEIKLIYGLYEIEISYFYYLIGIIVIIILFVYIVYNSIYFIKNRKRCEINGK